MLSSCFELSNVLNGIVAVQVSVRIQGRRDILDGSKWLRPNWVYENKKGGQRSFLLAKHNDAQSLSWSSGVTHVRPFSYSEHILYK